MSAKSTHSYQFGEFLLDPDRRLLLYRRDPVSLTPKAFDTLLVLLRGNGKVVEKDALIRAVWPDTFVEEATLAQNIFTLRKALGFNEHGRHFIETVPRHGYRFAVEVHEIPEADDEILFESHTTTRIVSEGIEDLDEGRNHQAFFSGSHAVEPIEQRSVLDQKVNSLPVRNARQMLALLMLVVAAVTLAVFLVLRVKSKDSAAATASFGRMRISKITNSGEIDISALSADGKYVAYVSAEDGNQSVWLKQTTGTNSLQIVAPSDSRFAGVAFSPDASSIYFTKYEASGLVGTLYQVPVLGGPTKKILSDIDSNVTFSPDAAQLAFFRNNPQHHQTALIIANADGSAERTLITHTGEFIGEGPAWSPDGQRIVFPIVIGDVNRSKASLFEVTIAGGVERPLTARQWNSIGQVVWLANGSGIAFDAWDESTAVFSSQLWVLTYPQGEARRITNDLNTYKGLSAAKANAVVTTQLERTSSFWLARTSDLDSPTQITSGAGDKRGEVMGMSWTSDNRIVYGSDASGKLNLWIMDPQDKHQSPLTSEPLTDFKPAVSPRGNLVVFVSRRTGSPHLWTMNIDGSNQAQLTSGNTETVPSVSPDGMWIAYISIVDSKPSLWKVGINGEKSVQLSEEFSWFPSVSPDGKLVACFQQVDGEPTPHISLIPAEGGLPKKISARPTTFIQGGLRWTHDGKSIAYVDNEDGTSNIWAQPIDGGAPKPLTHFKTGQIYRFAFSPDGNWLAYERGSTLRDVVKIDDLG